MVKYGIELGRDDFITAQKCHRLLFKEKII